MSDAPGDLSELQVGLRELALQRVVSGGLPRQAVEVLARLREKERTGLRGARQLPDGVMELEEEGVGEPPDVLEPPLGARFGGARSPGLPHGRPHASADDEHDEDRRGGRGRVAAQKLSRPIGEAAPPGLHGLCGEVPLQVRRKLLGGGVAVFRLRADRLAHDGIEVSAEPPGQAGGGFASLSAALFVLSGGFGRADSGAGPLGLARCARGVADPGKAARGRRSRAQRPAPGAGRGLDHLSAGAAHPPVQG